MTGATRRQARWRTRSGHHQAREGRGARFMEGGEVRGARRPTAGLAALACHPGVPRKLPEPQGTIGAPWLSHVGDCVGDRAPMRLRPTGTPRLPCQPAMGLSPIGQALQQSGAALGRGGGGWRGEPGRRRAHSAGLPLQLAPIREPGHRPERQGLPCGCVLRELRARQRSPLAFAAPSLTSSARAR